MPDTLLENEVNELLQQFEQTISQEVETELKKTAKIEIKFVLQGIEAIEPEQVLSLCEGECDILTATLSWNETSEQKFIFKKEDTARLLGALREVEITFDSVDPIIGMWVQAAQTYLGGKLDPAPKLALQESAARTLTADDLPESGLLFTYELQFSQDTISIFRIAPDAWTEMVRAAELEVTTVDEIPGQETPTPAEGDKPEVEGVEFEALQRTKAQQGGRPSSASINLLYDIKLDLVVELGRTRLPIREILNLWKGSIIELDKLAGDPLEIFVNDRKLAEGEVVVIDDHFGIRITQLVNQSERVRNLGAP